MKGKIDMKKKMPKFLKIILIIIAVLIGIVLLPIGCSAYNSYIYIRKEIKVDTQISPGDSYTIELYAVGQPAYGWYDETARGKVVLYEDDTEIAKERINVPIVDELKPTAAENWGVEWHEDMVRISIYYFDHGNKKMANQFEMYYDGTVQLIPRDEWR